GEEGHPITYCASRGEEVVIRGSEVYTNVWQPVVGHASVYSTKLPAEFFFPGFNPFKIEHSQSRGGGTQGQVFIEGRELVEAKRQVRSQPGSRRRVVEKSRIEAMYAQAGTWATEDGVTLYVHLPEDAKPPGQSLVELSVRRHLFAPVRRAQNYINVKGFIFEHCANDVSFPQVGAVSCRSGQQWIIEENTIRHIKTIGLDCGAEDEDPWKLPDTLPEDRFLVSRHHDIFELTERRIAGRNLILNNHVSDCGQCGIAGLFSDGSVIMGNVVERCGGVIPGFESAGIKVHGLMGGTIEGNLVRDNEAWGIWLDCGYIGSRVTRNVVINNKTSGIFFECCNGPGLIDNNVIAYNRGDGIYTHDASGVHVINNLIFNNTSFGIYMCVATDRLVPPYHYATGRFENEPSSCSWERICNNIILANTQGAISLPRPASRAQDNLSDFNLFDATSAGPRFVQHVRDGEHRTARQADDEARQASQKHSPDLGSAPDKVVPSDKGSAMDLAQWQAAAGNDLHSWTGSVSAHLDLSTFELTVSLEKNFAKLACKPVSILNVRDFSRFARPIDKDFRARAMPAKDWLPGAFQSLRSGNNELTVWPVKFPRPNLPPKVAIQPLPGCPGLAPVPAPPREVAQ
ncbi:MAG TPA: right-handed parallel beta-helix repeat-containing protein, partial [Verrucomicrobiae bacterium]|nr:right-handed parallel beta-helix repeat-containing protein [Verrucomicrobiae bacterium]